MCLCVFQKKNPYIQLCTCVGLDALIGREKQRKTETRRKFIKSHNWRSQSLKWRKSWYNPVIPFLCFCCCNLFFFSFWTPWIAFLLTQVTTKRFTAVPDKTCKLSKVWKQLTDLFLALYWAAPRDMRSPSCLQTVMLAAPDQLKDWRCCSPQTVLTETPK